MCGIVEFIDPALSAGAAEAALARMRLAIRHRGPDDEGQVTQDGVGLGVQRLSIVDLSAGHQPMCSEDGRIWLVFNGEIYNHAELRRRREAEGRRFRTRSDTEVVLAQYERFGLDGIRELNGMFAFAVWDGGSGELHLARDRMGVKPLYYYNDGRRLHFASELKALLRSGQLPAEPNAHAVWDYLTFRYVPAPQTIWHGVFKLPPAHTLSVRQDGLSATPKRYWDMPYVNASSADRSGSPAEFTALFDDAVRIRMLADVPVGIFLSGGLNSSAIAAAVNRQDFADLKTFSVTLEDAGDDDERGFAREVARHLATDHRELVVGTQQFIDFLPTLPLHTDEPLADPTCPLVYFLSQEARRHVKVVLSGEGADEILAGYSFDTIQRSWDQTAAAAAAANASPVTKLLRGWRPGAPAWPPEIDQRRVATPLHITNYLSSAEKASLFTPGCLFADSNEVLRRDVGRVRDNHPLHQSLYLYCQNWLVEDLLMKADKMSMAASLELRTPFLDYRMVEWAARAPASAKVRRLADGRYITKAVLRDHARDRLPATTIDRPKKGFSVPVYDWLSTRLRPFTMDLLGPQAKCSRWLDSSAVRCIAENGTKVDAPIYDRHRTWNLLVLELWARAWLP